MHHGFAAAGGIGGDDGAAHGHGFEHAARCAFAVGWQHVNRAGGDKGFYIVLVAMVGDAAIGQPRI